MLAAGYRVCRHAGQANGGQYQSEEADRTVGPRGDAQRRHEFIDVLRHACSVKRGDVGVHGGDFTAHHRDRVDAGRGADHQRDPLLRGLCVIGRADGEVDRRVRLVRDETLGNIVRDADHFEEAGAAGVDPRAKVESAGENLRRRGVGIGDLQHAAERILSLPEFLDQRLADDDGGGVFGLVGLAKHTARQNGDAGGGEIVLADDVAKRASEFPRTAARAGSRKGHLVDAHGNRHGDREAGGGDGREGLYAIEQFGEEGYAALRGVSIARRVERDEVKVGGIESGLHAKRRLNSDREKSEDHQQGQGSGHLRHHQDIAQA